MASREDATPLVWEILCDILCDDGRDATEEDSMFDSCYAVLFEFVGLGVELRKYLFLSLLGVGRESSYEGVLRWTGSDGQRAPA